MGKAAKRLKEEFSNTSAFDIFIKCIINGYIKLNGKSYSITALTEIDYEIDENHSVFFMKKNPKFYNLNYEKCDINFYNTVVSHILNKNNDWINDNYIDVLLSIYQNRRTVKFELTSIDKTKSVNLWFSVGALGVAITRLLASQIKSQFIKILGDSYEFVERVHEISDYDIESMYRITDACFINEPCEKSFIKNFIKTIQSVRKLNCMPTHMFDVYEQRIKDAHIRNLFLHPRV